MLSHIFHLDIPEHPNFSNLLIVWRLDIFILILFVNNFDCINNILTNIMHLINHIV